MASWVDRGGGGGGEGGRVWRENSSGVLELSLYPVFLKSRDRGCLPQGCFRPHSAIVCFPGTELQGPVSLLPSGPPVLSPETQLKAHGSSGKELCGLLHAAFTNREQWMHGEFTRPLGLIWFGVC